MQTTLDTQPTKRKSHFTEKTRYTLPVMIMVCNAEGPLTEEDLYDE